jgi:hypothetical protein
LKDNFKSGEHTIGNIIVALLFSATSAMLVGGLHDNFSKHMGQKELITLSLMEINDGLMQWQILEKDWPKVKLKTLKDFEKLIPINSKISLEARVGYFNYAQVNFADFDKELETFNNIIKE